MNAKPGLSAFCHVFSCNGQPHVYDVGTNDIYRIDPVLAAVLPLYGPLDEPAIVAHLQDSHAPAAVRAAITEIDEARQREGLFLSLRPDIIRTFPPHFDRKAYESRLSHLILTVTEQCNLRCRYCLHNSALPWIRPHRPRTMSTEVALRAIHYFAGRCGESENPTVSFYGGEPLLNLPLIRKTVAEARAHPQWPPLRFAIETNGTLITQDVAEFVVQEKIHLQISLDGDLAQHDRYRTDRNGHGSHAAVMAGLARLLDCNPEAAGRLSFNATLAPPYDIVGVAAYFADFPPFRERGIATPPRVRLNVAELDGVDLGAGATGQDGRPELERNLAAAERLYVQAHLEGRREALNPALRRFLDGPLITYHHRSRRPLDAQVVPGGCCLPGQRRLHVRVNGSFQPCERTGESLVMGSVEMGIDLERVEELFAAFYGALSDRCRQCWALRLCDICFLALAPAWDSRSSCSCAISEDLCASVRRRQEGLFRLYLSLLRGGPETLVFLQHTMIS